MMPDTPTGRIVRKVDSMGKALSVLAVVLALAGLVAAVGVATWINSPAQQQAISQRAASDAAKAAADLQAQQALAALDLQASQQSAARWAVFWDVVTPLAWLVLAVLALCVVVGVPAGLGIWLAMQWDERRKRRVVYYADARGLLPVTPAALDTAATVALAGHHQAAIEAARRPAFSGGARSERISISQGTPAPQAQPNRPAVELAPPQQAPALPGPVALANVLTWTPDLSRILIGLDPAGRPLVVSARELCHVALVGATGGGKSNALRLLLGQLLAAGARAVLIDPHYSPHDPDDPNTGDWRPIEARLYRPPSVLPSEMSAAFDWLSEELETRLARRRAGERSGPPLFVAIDELPSIVGKVEHAPEVLTSIVREGRKVGLLAITSSQDFLVKSIGTGSAARDNFRTAIYAGGDQVSARVLLDVPAKSIPEGELGRGVVMLRSQATPAAGLARLPLVTDADLTRLLPPPAGVASNPAPTRRPSLLAAAYPQAQRPPLTVLPGGSSSSSSSRMDAENDPDGDENEAEVTTTTTTAPSTLVGKARSMGIDLDAEDWRVLDLLDQGKSYHKVGELLAGRSGGTAYSKWRGQAERLHDLIKNWPDGERWSTAADGD